ncbi:hypothetical protein EVAR_62908_1 [Eumeta japonica]|uniref:Uncharacterized protein n=1 Tax=Eumeta variegata TaxID=151549 RepID=A0A4C1Y9W1_EUMVA|nr:hypothetical protein EVAR_62908_1 [Eumeta japonica]
MKWKDKRDILVLSTKHSVKLPTVKKKRGNVLCKPETIFHYSKGKSGCEPAWFQCHSGVWLIGDPRGSNSAVGFGSPVTCVAAMVQ